MTKSDAAAEAVTVRRGTAADADVVAHHRAAMFRDMGSLRPELYGELRDASRGHLARALAGGEYLAWLACPADRPGEVVAGAGVQIRPQLPRPAFGCVDAIELRPQALVLNVYTEPPWRRRGLAELLMRHVMDWARGHGTGGLVLHASDEGRRLYERLGFAATNEMRHDGRF